MKIRKFFPLFCFVMSFLLFAGCGSSDNPTPPPPTPAVSPQPAVVGAGQTLQFTTNITGSAVNWTVSGSSGGTINAQGVYTAPAATQNTTATVTATSMSDPAVTASATVNIIAAGVVATTANPQVALYTISVPDGFSAFIQFSTDTSYNLFTSSIPAPTGGGAVPILVAGMKGNTPYHMRAVFQATGTTNNVFTDADHTFTTTSYPAANLPVITATIAPGQTPQPGVELLDLLSTTGGTRLTAAVTDLSGNLLWAYDPGTAIAPGTIPNPIKLLPNGHFLIVYSGINPDGINSLVQEVDLAGTVVWSMNSAQLNSALAAATCAGCNITVIGFHHDFAVLPNGHIVFLVSTQQTVSSTLVTGDVLVDFDTNRNPVWLWNAFDHLDITRQPMQFPDWTHSNSVVYSPDDKSLVLSVRHQAWVLKINYNDGAGDGSLIWKLGYQGDFALQAGSTNAVDPVDWFSAQHDANIISTNTSGMIDVLLFDNGNQRILQASPLTLCGPTTTPCDSRVPILHLDETAKTADITWIDKLAPVFSFFGGSARQLSNGNIEFDVCGFGPLTDNSSQVFEVTKTTPPTTVWSMQISGQYAYRATRIGSLYPNVQW
jgi:arylsulfate sulfotransferase